MLVKAILPCLLVGISWAQFDDDNRQMTEGRQAVDILNLRQQLAPLITNEFNRLQAQLLSSIKTTMTNELKKVKDEVELKTEQTASSVTQILQRQDNIVQQLSDLSITFENLQKQSYTNLQTTTESLTTGFFETKSEVGQQMALFKSELQQSRTHLDNFASKLESATGSTLMEHTSKIYEQLDRSRKDTVNSVNSMHTTLTQRITQMSSRSVNEFKQRELVLKRSIQEEFSAVSNRLDNSLTTYKRDLDKSFTGKVEENLQLTSENNNIMLQTVNSTLGNNVALIQDLLGENEIEVNKILRDTSGQINDTLSGQAELSKKYVEHTIGSFRDDINSIITNMQNQFDDALTTNGETLRNIKSLTEESKLESQRGSKEMSKALEQMGVGFKMTQNKIDIGVSKLNRSMTDRAWMERRELIDQMRKSQDIVTRAMNNNHDHTKVMVENSVSKTLKDALRSQSQNFEEIMKKITQIEDGSEDVRTQLSDAMQNIVRDTSDELKNEMAINKADLQGALTTISSSVQACVRKTKADKPSSSILPSLSGARGSRTSSKAFDKLISERYGGGHHKRIKAGAITPRGNQNTVQFGVRT